MDNTLVDKERLIQIMRIIQGERSQVEFAKSLGVTAQHLSDIYNGYRNPGKAILTSLGYERRIMYATPKR